jgi:hypothetical protein
MCPRHLKKKKKKETGFQKSTIIFYWDSISPQSKWITNNSPQGNSPQEQLTADQFIAGQFTAEKSTRNNQK